MGFWVGSLGANLKQVIFQSDSSQPLFTTDKKSLTSAEEWYLAPSQINALRLSLYWLIRYFKYWIVGSPFPFGYAWIRHWPAIFTLAQISLSLFLIHNWDFHSFIFLALNIATDISPKKMTFILKQNYQLHLIRFHCDELLAIGSILLFFWPEEDQFWDDVSEIFSSFSQPTQKSHSNSAEN